MLYETIIQNVHHQSHSQCEAGTKKGWLDKVASPSRAGECIGNLNHNFHNVEYSWGTHLSHWSMHEPIPWLVGQRHGFRIYSMFTCLNKHACHVLTMLKDGSTESMSISLPGIESIEAWVHLIFPLGIFSNLSSWLGSIFDWSCHPVFGAKAAWDIGKPAAWNIWCLSA